MILKDRSPPLDRDAAEAIAVQALAYLADDSQLLDRFMRLTGLTPATLRQSARDPAFLVAVLDFLVFDEALVVDFAAAHDIPPERVGAAHRLLAGNDADP